MKFLFLLIQRELVNVLDGIHKNLCHLRNSLYAKLPPKFKGRQLHFVCIQGVRILVEILDCYLP